VDVVVNDLLIRVLGPIDARGPSGSIAVGGKQVRALLGALAIGGGRAVSIDHIHEVLWGDDPPESAENTLQSYISHLRNVLGGEAIVMVDHSYKLATKVVEIDAVVFERLVGEAADSRESPERCQDLCRRALVLWRGRPFGDLADDETFRLEAYRLDQLRLVVMELTLEADLMLGHDELVVGELEIAVAEHPYREHLWYLLIGALARTDRRVEAMRACSRLRAQLAEAGLEPSDHLVAMEQDILDGREPSIAQ
jgi:DNA-binding SARP family transcriptional activator